MNKPAQKLQGEAGFNIYYSKLFGEERYQQLLSILKTPSLPILFVPKQNLARVQQLWHDQNLTCEPLVWFPQAVLWPKEAEANTQLPGADENLFYVMNASSLLPVLALQPQPSEIILDACAAPGGKALCIADQLGEGGKLIANDLSSARRLRMKTLFENFAIKNITVLGKQAETLFKLYPNYFDKVLVDAPCSSEKHVLNSPHHLQQWSYSRIKQLKQRQLALLSGLFLSLKPGGRLVYSTCALNTEENEEVVAKLLQKKKSAIKLLAWSEVIQHSVPGSTGLAGEYQVAYTVHNVHRVMPELGSNLDPMFVAIFERIK